MCICVYIYIYKLDVDKLVHVSGDLELDPHLPKKIVICFMESPLKRIKKWFLFHQKRFFVLKIFKFLSWLFDHVEKTAWLER